MKIPAAIAACMLGSVSAASPATAPRQSLPINEGWSFLLEDAADDGQSDGWQDTDLPHTWNAADGRNKNRPYHRGIGRYRKALFIEPWLAGSRLWLRFEGANQIATVTVNGEPAGRHIGGYSAFAFDITDLVQFGTHNPIEVRVDNRHDPDVPPLDADFTFYGGIYRDVRLLVMNDVHFAVDEYAADDLRITPTVSEAQARIDIDAGVANTSRTRRTVRLHAAVVDAEESTIAEASTLVALEPGEVSQHRLPALAIEDPELWSPESPCLYRLVGTIRDGESIIDRVEYPLGFRWFEFDAQTGFRLNGKPYRLFGTNRHQDHAGLGNALPDVLHRADLQKIKDNGFNFLRLAHYPQDPAVLEAADEFGLLIWEETPIVNLIGLSAAFRQNSTRMVREMVRQHRHHPSVIFWGYMNEVTLVAPDPVPPNYYEEVLALAKHLNAVAHEEDPLRPTAMALSRDEVGGDGWPLHTVPDVVGLNLYFGWYYDELHSLGPFLDRLHRQQPDLPLFVSEYGAGSDERVHSLRPEPFDFSAEYQQRFHEAAFRQILERPWLVGSAVWAQFDFGSDYRQDTMFGINQKGLWYYDRRPKDVAEFYRARLSDEPVLHIAARDWRHRAGSRAEDAVMPVRVYSNEESAELFVNGSSLGSKRIRNATAVWDVALVPGNNKLSAHSANRTDAVSIRYEDRSSVFDGDPAPGVAILVNAGAGEQFIDADERVWEADREYSAGSWGYVGGTARRHHRRIHGTKSDPLYQTRRSGPHTYRFDVADGDYRLGLHFASVEAAEVARLGVEVNGRRLDVAIPEPFTRHTVGLRLSADGDGVTLRLDAGSGEAFVNGILLQRVEDSAPSATAAAGFRTR